MLNIIGTIDRPTKGLLEICGSRIGSRTKDSELATLRLKKMGFVFQTFNLLSTMTALQNVEMPMILAGKLSKKQRIERAKMLLEKVGMGNRMDHLPAQLSGGEQQRVTIARAIANSPEILLLDEPTGDLDTKNTLIVMDMLCRLNEEEGITCIMVTHDPSLKNLGTKIVNMRDGKIHRVDLIDKATTKKYRDQLREQLKNVVGDLADVKIGHTQTFTAKTEVRQPRDYDTFSKEGILYELELNENRFSIG